jgi:hypothetical protein
MHFFVESADVSAGIRCCGGWVSTESAHLGVVRKDDDHLLTEGQTQRDENPFEAFHRAMDRTNDE